MLVGGACLESCEIATIELPVGQSALVVHGMLSPTTTTQTVLLERTLTGAVPVPLVYPFDGAEPIASDYGIAEGGATAEILTPAGEVIVGRELSAISATGHGGGVYVFPLPGASLVPGGRYRLRMTTTKNETLTAETTVPLATSVATGPIVTFNRSSDTLSISWNPASRARGYQVRIESPYGPWVAYTDSTHIALTGTLRNLLADRLPNLFIPGFRQLVTVSAVDSNYYDWYRTHNDALSGTGLINRVRGGFGVFGSLVRLRFVNLEVTGPQTEAIAGNFNFLGSDTARRTTPYLALHLYVESPSLRSDQGDALSGRFERRPTFTPPNEPIDGLLGTVRKGKVELAFLRNWSASDTVEVFRGEIRGDTIVGTYRGFGGIATFVRQRP